MKRLPPARREVLDDGLVLVYQRVPDARALSLGVWTRTGARDERPGEEGLCHFLEHMLFRGTRRRDAHAISLEIERAGGTLDAFTTRDTMCVHAQVLASDAELAFDLVGDMLTASTFDDNAIALERRVVLEEIHDAEDAPDDFVHELFGRTLFGDHPCGRPILGTRRSVRSFTRERVRRFARRVLRAGNVVVAVCGDVDARRLRAACRRHLALPPGRPRIARHVPLAPPGRRRRHVRRDLAQQHVVLGARALAHDDPRRHALAVLSTALGGGMSSRLFRRVRDELGLAYSVYTWTDATRDTGALGVYLATGPHSVSRALEATMAEIDALRRGEMDEDEVEAARQQLRGRVLLGLETTTSRMMRLARNELVFGRPVPEGRFLRELARVRRDDVVALVRDLLRPEALCVASLGPAPPGDAITRNGSRLRGSSRTSERSRPRR